MSQTSNVAPLRIADNASAIRHLFIRNLVLDVEIGVYASEKGRKQPVRLNVDLSVVDIRTLDDRLEQVVDYAEIVARIRAIVAAGHINLAETLAEHIAATCLEDVRVRAARVRVEKLAVIDGAESAGVEIERVRG